MLWHTALLVALLVHQVPAEYAKPVYIEDVARNSGSRIVSGWEARPGQHPHQVALRQVNAAGGVSGCGGSVVHREWVITAAHCTAGSVTIVIRAGVTHMTRPQYMFESTEWYNHPTFNANTPTLVQPNDISILKLLRRVTYNEYLRPIRVQLSRDAYRDYDGERVLASGFGRTWTGGATPETLNWVYLLSVSNTRCRSTFGSIITDTTICASFYNVTSQSICQGDSGGPLVYEDSDGTSYLIGVSSFVAGGNFGCHSGLPGGFIRPGPFLHWFKEITGVDFENLKEEDSSEESSSEEDSSEEQGEIDTPTTTTEKWSPTNSTDGWLPTNSTDGWTTTNSTEGWYPTNSTGGWTTTNSTDGWTPTNSTGGLTPTNSTDGWYPTTPLPTPTRPPGPSPTPPPPSPPPPESESEEDSDEDPELSEILKRLEVKVKVKVRFTKSKTIKDC